MPLVALERRSFLGGLVALLFRRSTMSRYGLHGKMVATAGQRDALVEHLLTASRLVSDAPGCELYYVSTSPTEPDAVWVTEVWRSKEDHDGSLKLPGVRELIQKARPLIGSMGESFVTTPVGGKGIGGG